MKPLHRQLQSLEDKKKKLEEEITRIRQKKNEELMAYLNVIPDIDLDVPTLIGGILYLGREAGKDVTKKEVWRKEGERFRRSISATKALRSSSKVAEEKTATE